MGMRRYHVLLTVGLAVLLLAGFRPTFAANCLSRVDAPGCSHGLPADQYQQLLGIMAANPGPAVHGLPVDQAELLKYSDTGKAHYHMASAFTGVMFDAPPALSMGWIIKAARPLPLPGGDYLERTDAIPRYTIVYIYATQRVDGQNWYLIGPGQWVQSYKVARLAPPTRPAGVGGRWIAVDVAQEVLTAYENDQLVFATLISSGAGTRPTRTGLTPIYLRQLTGDMSALMGTPDQYNIYDVPYIMYFNDGMALHAAPWHNNFGYPMSHGCVNMSMSDARWLFGWTESAPAAPVLVWRSK
jgi:hypothetical protein